MAISDFFKASKIKAENEDLKNLISPELQDAVKRQEYLRDLEDQIQKAEKKLSKLNTDLDKTSALLEKKKAEIITTDEDILVQEFGLYQPHYDFMNAELYKQKLNEIRSKQKEAIKNGRAVSGNMNWTVNGSKSQGNKMIKDMQKLLLRAFNSECDELISKVKYNNYDTSLKRITASVDAISKLGSVMSLRITRSYYDLKVQELQLALEYQIKKQEEKEALREARAEMREAAKLQKELEEQRKKIEKEQSHYQRALSQIMKQLEHPNPEIKDDLLAKKKEIEDQLQNIDTSLSELDYRAANQRAGYVYVISNIGSFGENIYKIGMTRRLDPQDRIDELGDASVPFNFDVHAMIFTDDAPALENALHKAFEDRKVNMINHRREFFNVTLEEIKEVIRQNYDKTVEFVEIPEAEQFRESQLVRLRNHLPQLSRTEAAATKLPVPDAAPAESDSEEKEYIYTKWGRYEKPNPYKVNFARNYPPQT